MNNGKFKKFVEEHKVEIAYGAGAIIAIVSMSVGVKITNAIKIRKINSNPGRKIVKDVLDDLNGKMVSVFGGIADGGFIPEQLGELGKKMLEEGVPEDFKFTHFIAIGESKK